MKWYEILLKLRDEVVAHLPVFMLGVALGGLLAAMPLALAMPLDKQPEMGAMWIVAPKQQPEKGCDAVWQMPYDDLTAAERETRQQCDEIEALLLRDAELAEQEQGE